MSKRCLAVAAVAAATLLAVPLPATASAAPTQALKLRGGLTLHLPATWKAHRVAADWTRVVTGKCAKPTSSYGTPGCDSFWVLGPKASKRGDEIFRPYTGARPFYPATDVQPCPHNGAWSQVLGKIRTKGLRQVGPGHKAAYNEWNATCVTRTRFERKSRYVQREWYLPATGILVVDQWSTPGLAAALKDADWR
ncbi:hypothetical protein ABGB18_37635 [Nonomuraea sp. B12E4]|uniref:hypothetical protein n=1 Tax=Nonomuraea sp. B12E4 TaxID=3153564 RepID=UPI00325E0180